MMGLCKCSKRKVTNLFCFVHRVNVCEDCMIQQHNTCVVHSYLKWLEDSDYEELCLLCSHSIQQGEIVRLTCYDLFHYSCLEAHVRNCSTLDYRCPKCKESLVPQSNLDSPVANKLRCCLTSMGLVSKSQILKLAESSVPIDLPQSAPSRLPQTVPDYSQDRHRTIVDNDDNKYMRKSWSEVTKHWMRRQSINRTVDSSMRRLLVMVALAVLAVVTCIVLLTRVGRDMASKDSTLDWNFNPNLKTGD